MEIEIERKVGGKKRKRTAYVEERVCVSVCVCERERRERKKVDITSEI